MLNDLIELKKKRDRQKADDFYQKALSALSKNLSSQVALLLDKAIQCDKSYILKLLERDVNKWVKEGRFSEAACLGYVQLHHQPKNFELANKIGNCERKMKRYKEANALYRHALKVNRNFDWAIHNMAASMGKVNIYDGDIRELIKTYIRFDTLLLPDINYFEVPSVMEPLFLKFKHEEYCEKVNELQYTLLTSEVSNHEIAEKKVSISAKMMKNKYLREAKQLDYREKANQMLAKIAAQNWDIYSEREKVTIGWEIYNIAIKIFSQHTLHLKNFSKNSEFVQSENFQYIKTLLLKLREEKVELKYLEMLIAIIYFLEGNQSESTDILKKLLGENRDNRFYNVNLGLIYYHSKNRLMSFKHLVKGAIVLKDLEGYYLLSDIVLLAQRKQVEKDYETALTLYKIVANETDDVKYLKSLGGVLLEIGHYNEAIELFLEIRKISPESTTAKNQLEKLVLILKKIGEEAWEDNQLQTALDAFLNILKIKRNIPEVLRKTASLYKRMGNQKEAFLLTKERELLMAKIEEGKKERMRLILIEKGKSFIQNKKFNDGIQCLNDAMLMKADKHLYGYLSNLYKKLHFKKALLKLEDRWSRMYREEPENP